MNAIDPEKVRAALDRMKTGDSSREVLETLVEAAELYADMHVEFGMPSPQPTLFYASQNDMLIETMHAGRPTVDLLARVAGNWRVVRPGTGVTS